MFKKLLIITVMCIMYVLSHVLSMMFLLPQRNGGTRIVTVRYDARHGLWYAINISDPGLPPLLLPVILQKQLNSPKYLKLIREGNSILMITNYRGNMVLGVAKTNGGDINDPKALEIYHIDYCLHRVMRQLRSSNSLRDSSDVYSINGGAFTLTA